MLAVRGGEEEIAEIIRRSTRLNIAAVNVSKCCRFRRLEADCRVFVPCLPNAASYAQPLTVSHAFHSVLMEPILDEFERQAAKFPCTAPELPLVSNVSGKVLSSSRIASDASYWRRHIRSAVRFSDGLFFLMAQHPAGSA